MVEMAVPLREAVPFAVEHGFDVLELNMENGFARETVDPAEIRTPVEEAGLDLVVHLPFRLDIGSPHPEGYRKAGRLMELAEKFGKPVITMVDTQGAYPGIGAEERGQAEAIAANLKRMAGLRTPLVTCVIGEGGSGGALGIAVADRVLMMENAIYSVISPEGCASILWRSGEHTKDAAEQLKLTAQDLHKLQVIDQVIEEPLGGAHRDKAATIDSVGDVLEGELHRLRAFTGGALKRKRRDKYLEMGQIGLS